MRSLFSLLFCLVCAAACAQARKVFPLLNSYANATPFLIQSVPTNAWAGYSMTRRLSSSYTGNAFQVTRSSDNTTAEIGFVNGVLTDTNALVSFVGAGTGYLTVLYDQSGNTRDMDDFQCTPITNCAPQIIINGTMQVDDSNRVTAYLYNVLSGIQRDAVPSAPALPDTYFFVGLPLSYGDKRTFCSLAPGASDWITVNSSALGQINTADYAIANGAVLTGGIYCVGEQYLWTCYFESGASDSVQLVTESVTTGDAGNDASANVGLGSGASGDSNTADYKFSEWIIYDIALSSADRLTIQRNITNFYNISTDCDADTLNSGLISYWKMDETSGSRADSGIDGNTLTDNNTVTSSTGIISNAGQFTAANSEYLSRADNASLTVGNQDATWAVWARADSDPTADRYIFSKYKTSSNQREYALLWQDTVNRFRFQVSNDGIAVVNVDANSLGAPATNTWYFIVVWHDATADTINIQVNNGTVDSTSHSTGIFGIGTASFFMGAVETTVPTLFWDGRIDEVPFWKKVLTSDERTRIYNSGAGRSCCPFLQ